MGNKNLIITIEREYGSGGRIVGKKLAEALGLSLIHIFPVVMLGMIIASIVIFCVNVKKTRLLPGNWPEGIEDVYKRQK